MNILVVGCGKVGSRLANVLSSQGHDISVVSRDESDFELLAPDFNGYTTSGVPIDQEVLKKAGIESCDALAAMTPDDNTNIMVSQLAQEVFKVPRVLGRIYDPSREDVFSHFGLQTVCPTNLTVSAVRSALLESHESKSVHLGSHTLHFSAMDIPKEYVDSKVSDIVFEEDEVLYAIERDARFMLVGIQNLTLKKGDRLIFSTLVD